MYLWPDGKQNILIDQSTCIAIDYNDKSLDALVLSIFFVGCFVSILTWKKMSDICVHFSREHWKKIWVGRTDRLDEITDGNRWRWRTLVFACSFWCARSLTRRTTVMIVSRVTLCFFVGHLVAVKPLVVSRNSLSFDLFPYGEYEYVNTLDQKKV